MDIDRLFEDFKSKKIIIVGDVMVDSYLNGTVSRLSPEAPVPVVNLKNRQDRLGGAANVALNIQSLGAIPYLCTCVGQDAAGELFVDLLKNQALPTKGVLTSDQVKTTVKTRVIGNQQQLVRIDDERIQELDRSSHNQLIERFKDLLNSGVDAVIFEDYNKGLLSSELIEVLIKLANEKNLVITVDPKKENFWSYRNVTLFKPNLKELKEGLKKDFSFPGDKDSFEEAVDALMENLNCEYAFVTLSEHGVFIQDKNEKNYIPAHVRTIADVSGAGDTVIAVATLCLLANLSSVDVAKVANLSGGLVCEHTGVVSIDPIKLKHELMNISA